MKQKVCILCGPVPKLWRSKPPLCGNCINKWRKEQAASEGKTFYSPITKITPKQAKKIDEDKAYYKRMIFLNLKKNKLTCLCDNCDSVIKRPTGRNICHLLSKGAFPSLYHEDINSFLLGKGPLFDECDCGEKFDNSGKRSEMKIFPEYQRRWELLNQMHYNKTA